MSSSEEPRLNSDGGVEGEPIAYRCSLCSQLFLLPDDRPSEEAVAEVQAAFRQHVLEEHAGEAQD